jgi:hypothetical protein
MPLGAAPRRFAICARHDASICSAVQPWFSQLCTRIGAPAQFGGMTSPPWPQSAEMMLVSLKAVSLIEAGLVRLEAVLLIEEGLPIESFFAVQSASSSC